MTEERFLQFLFHVSFVELSCKLIAQSHRHVADQSLTVGFLSLGLLFGRLGKCLKWCFQLQLGLGISPCVGLGVCP